MEVQTEGSADVIIDKSVIETPIPLSILDLNDDCLIEIFSYLADVELSDILGICPRFDNIIHIILRHCDNILVDFRSISADKNFMKFFRTISRYLRSISFSFGYSISTNLVLLTLQPIAYCERLQHLTLHYVTMCKDYLDLIGTISSQLEMIDFSFCQLTDELMEDFFKQHCQSLETFKAFGNYTFNGNSLFYLKNVKKMVLERHESFEFDGDRYVQQNPKCQVSIYLQGRENVVEI